LDSFGVLAERRVVPVALCESRAERPIDFRIRVELRLDLGHQGIGGVLDRAGVAGLLEHIDQHEHGVRLFITPGGAHVDRDGGGLVLDGAAEADDLLDGAEHRRREFPGDVDGSGERGTSCELGEERGFHGGHRRLVAHGVQSCQRRIAFNAAIGRSYDTAADARMSRGRSTRSRDP